MNPTVLFFGWNRSTTGREKLSAQHFKEFSEYLAAQKSQGAIESFEPVLLQPTGSNLNGFFLIRGASHQLNKLTASPEWLQHITRALLHLDQPVVTRGVNGSALMEHMGLWMKSIPQS